MNNARRKILLVFSFLSTCALLHAQEKANNRNNLCDEFDIIVPTESINVCNNGDWVLVFEDDFDSHQLYSIWQNSPNRQGALYGNNGVSQEYNTLDNVEISNGSLIIIADCDTVQRKAFDWKLEDEILSDGLRNLREYHYTSGYLETKVNFDFGLLEAMVKIPKGKGFWPAFWMYDNYNNQIYNELDIFEFWNETNSLGNYVPSLLSKVHVMTSHYRDVADQCSFDYEGCDYSEGFHKFSVKWEPNVIEWYVDDVLKRRDVRYHTLSGQEVGCILNPYTYYQEARVFPQHPMHIIFNLAIQHSIDTTWAYNDPSLPITGIIDNSPDEDTPFPSEMEIQWVRYFQRIPHRDVQIENSLQYQLTPDLYNVIAGENVSIDCGFIIQNEEFLTILANHTTTIGPGFNAKPGSNVRISSYTRSLDENIFQHNENVQMKEQILKQQIIESDEMHNGYSSQGLESICNTSDISESNINNFTISVYPIPSHGSFYIEIDNEGDDRYELTLKNIMGTTVITKSINAARTKIVHNTPGVYYVCLRSKSTGLFMTKKLIIL